MTILKANTNHIEDLVTLFDAYRVIYKQASDIKSATSFLLNRLKLKDSIMLFFLSCDFYFFGGYV